MKKIGIAMTRAMGDHALRPFGVISTPEITTHTIDPSIDRVLFLATDGIFEVLNNQDSIDFLGEEPCKNLVKLVDAAKAKWQNGLPMECRRDDIAVALASIGSH